MSAHLAFDDAMLAALRRMPGEEVLRRLAIQMKADPTYVPRKDTASRRWHVLTERGDFEILTTGHKWFDTREDRGGASGIDLAMHVLAVSFVEAVKRLMAERQASDTARSSGSRRPEPAPNPGSEAVQRNCRRARPRLHAPAGHEGAT